MANTIKWFPGVIVGLRPRDDDGKVSFDTDGSIFIERSWTCVYNNAFALCPKPRDAAPAGTPGTNTRCITSSYERWKADAAIVRATYQGIWNMPFTVYQMDASRYERPITYHPQFNNEAVFGASVPGGQYPWTKIVDGQIKSGVRASTFIKFRDVGQTDDEVKFRGIEAYMVATAVWRKTSYTLTPTFTLDNLFKIDTPDTGGLWSVSNQNQWLKADKTYRNMYRGASQVWEIQESWLYNQNGWLTEIYA